jgi:GntR family transcriptional regulator
MIMNGVGSGTTGSVDRKNQEKLYIQVMRILVDEIAKGTWAIGDRIPSEGELSALYAVSKITVRQALTNLTADGYLVRVQGKGTFVAGNRPVVGLTMKTRFTDGLFGGEVGETREVLERGVAELPAEVSRLLGIEGPLYRIATRRLAEGVPVSTDESFIPPGLLPGIEEQGLEGFRLFEAIQERGTRKVFRMRQTVEIAPLSAVEARILGASAGQPALAVHRLLIGPEDQPLGYSRIVEIGERFKLETEFERIR